MKQIGFVFIVIYFSACSTGTKVTENDLSKIKIGETTYSQVVELLGEPQNQQQVSNEGPYYSKKCGDKGETIRYAQYMQTTSKVVSVKYQSKTIFFNSADKACDVRDQSGGASTL